MEESGFINKVELSGIITLDLLKYAPTEEIVLLDIKDFLFMEMIIKESEFRKLIDAKDWSLFKYKLVAVSCSTDAIIPTWAYMVIACRLQGNAFRFDYLNPESMKLQLWKENLLNADFSHLSDQKVVIRANASISPSLYLLITDRLKPLVKTLMFGEAGLPKVIYKKS